MTDPQLSVVQTELLREAIISSAPPQRLGFGNVDRRAEHEKQIYRVELADGRAAKLTIGRNLTDLTARSRAWAEAFPTLTCQSLLERRIGDSSVLLETFFDGVSLEHAIVTRALPLVVAHQGFIRVLEALVASRIVSTVTARAQEWQTWSRSICAIPFWSPTELAFLEHALLPALAAKLFQDEPHLQWVHGDLIDRNFLLNARGVPCLIDPEFAQRTHFYPAETSRFYALSAAAREQFGFFNGLWSEPGEAWELFFWLSQIQREAIGNTDAYMAKWLPHRLATVHRLGEIILPDLRSWPWTKDHASEAEPRAIVKFHRSERGEAGTCQTVQLKYSSDRPQTLFLPLNEGFVPYTLQPAHSSSLTVLRRIATHSGTYQRVDEFAGPQLHTLQILPLHGTTLKYLPDGIGMAASGGAPQVILPDSVQTQAEWLEIELAPEARSWPTNLFRLEECRWLDQPSSLALRISGWCVAPDRAELARVEVMRRGQVLSASAMNPRADVQRFHGGHAAALHSGFVLEFSTVDPNEFLELVAVTSSGRRLLFETVQPGDFSGRGQILDDYPTWAKRHDPDPPAPSPASEIAPKFSILLPVYNSPIEFLRECLISVRKQYFEAWELCVVDDASTRQDVLELLDTFAREDVRIRLHRRSSNGGISRATNDALAMATGDYVVMLDHDDLLRPHALLELARKIKKDASVDVIYTDEDKITSDGQRIVPFLKPAFSPEYLLRVMYPGHLLCVRRTVAQAIRGFDSAYDGIQDYEFFLRLTEDTRRIEHLPLILYHWRQSPSSSALEGNVKGDMDSKQIAAVRAHLLRRDDHRSVKSLGRHRLELHADRNPRRRIAVLLAWDHALSEWPDCDWRGLLENTASIYALPTVRIPSNVRPVTRCSDENWGSCLHRLRSDDVADVLVVFTAPPVTLSDRYIDELAAFADLNDSGCVAPVVISREGIVFESGRTHSIDGSHPVMRGFRPDGDGYNGALLCSREVAAVSSVSFALRADRLTISPVATLQEWLAFCESLRVGGLFNRVCAHARIQIPLSWRQSCPTRTVSKLPPIDPFFNPHFDGAKADYSLARPPRHHVGGRPAFQWHVDTPLGTQLSDGCLTLRGWCFRSDRSPIVVLIRIAGMKWSAACDQSRPDVGLSYGDPLIDRCGFTLDLRVPAGEHDLELEAVGENDARELMLRQRIKVPLTAGLRRWINPRVRHRAAFQLMAAPSAPSRVIEREKFPPRRTESDGWPRFAIVTPSFQQGRYLSETIRSVLEQPEVKCDYVVQDGGSTDTSVEIIHQEKAHLFAWESKPDAGQGDAIAQGFHKTSGRADDIMAWLNSDDFYLPGALAFVADYFARHPHVDVLYGNRVVVDAESNEVGRWLLPAHDPAMLEVNDFVPQETTFWRRRIWDRVGGIDRSFKFALDWDLLLRFQAAGAKIVHVPYFLACFRIHSAQKTSALMEAVGKKEIAALRLRTFGRAPSLEEIERHPQLIRYVRKSAWSEFLWRRFRIRSS